MPDGVRLYTGVAVEKLRAAGALLGLVLKELVGQAVPGNCTAELNRLSTRLLADAGAIPLFLDYEGFPYVTCLSNNDCMVHGFPDESPLRAGDILSIDLGLSLSGFCADAARTVIVGKVESEHQKLVDTTEAAYRSGLAVVNLENTVGDIGFAIQCTVLSVAKVDGQPWTGYRYQVYPNFQGHGIGLELHEEPPIMNIGYPGCGPMLRAGMCFTIEPVLMYEGSQVITTEVNGCKQFHTSDLRPTAHYENTVYIHEGGQVEVFTDF